MGCRTTWVLDCLGLEDKHWLMAYGTPGLSPGFVGHLRSYREQYGWITNPAAYSLGFPGHPPRPVRD